MGISIDQKMEVESLYRQLASIKYILDDLHNHTGMLTPEVQQHISIYENEINNISDLEMTIIGHYRDADDGWVVGEWIIKAKQRIEELRWAICSDPCLQVKLHDYLMSSIGHHSWLRYTVYNRWNEEGTFGELCPELDK